MNILKKKTKNNGMGKETDKSRSKQINLHLIRCSLDKI